MAMGVGFFHTLLERTVTTAEVLSSIPCPCTHIQDTQAQELGTGTRA